MQALRGLGLRKERFEQLNVEQRLRDMHARAVAFNLKTISQALSTRISPQTETSLYLFNAPSKNIRLSFANGVAGCLLARQGLGDEQIESRLQELSPWISSLEMIHTSSLYHDDVLDNAPTRRGVPAAHTRFPFVSVTVAPYHIIASSQKINQCFGDNRILELIHEMVSALEQGEYMQEEAKRIKDFDAGNAFAHYLEKNFKKTASIFFYGVEGLCRLLEVESSLTESLLKAAFLAGVSFQIRDDLLDYTLTSKEIYKDFKEKIATLPLFELAKAEGKEAAQRFFEGKMQVEELISGVISAKCEQFVDNCFAEFCLSLQQLQSAHLPFLASVCHKMFYRKG